jgi:hypothetical protein
MSEIVFNLWVPPWDYSIRQWQSIRHVLQIWLTPTVRRSCKKDADVAILKVLGITKFAQIDLAQLHGFGHEYLFIPLDVVFTYRNYRNRLPIAISLEMVKLIMSTSVQMFES